jgi:Rhs element Vgr protein
MSVVTPTILSEGTEMDPTFSLLSLDIHREVGRIPSAELCLVDGSATGRSFAISDSDFFQPGKLIEIKLRQEDGADQAVFKGLTIRQGVEATGDESTLTVGLKDAAIRLTGPRRSVVYREQSDDQIISTILQAAGLEKGTIAATKPKHPEIVQYNCSDWDFILSRADTYGLCVVADDGKVSLCDVGLTGNPRHSFEWGIQEIFEFEMEADANHQYNALESIAWDLRNQKLTTASKAKSITLSQGNLDGGNIAKALGFETCTLSHPVPIDPEELKAWADARMTRTRMAMLRGRLAVSGLAEIKPLDEIEVSGIGERFNGKTLVTGVHHRVEAGSWLTDVHFGLSPEGFWQQEQIIAPAAAGLLPAVRGLQIGVVGAFEEDPIKEFRVRVILPAIDDKKGVVWARLASPDAGKGRGYFFRPEPGDEVVVGFFNNDPRHAVVLGSLYGSKNNPPSTLAQISAENPKKGIVTKKGSTLQFHDTEKASVFIETAQKNRIVFNDETELIQISDQHGNSMTMNKDGIEIKSIKDIKIIAEQNVEVTAQTTDVKCSKDIKIAADNKVESTSKNAEVKCSKNIKVTAGDLIRVSAQTTDVKCSKDMKIAASRNLTIDAMTCVLRCSKDANITANKSLGLVGMTTTVVGNKDVSLVANNTVTVNGLTTKVNGMKDLKLSSGMSIGIEGVTTAIKCLKDVNITALKIALKGAQTAITGTKSVNITAAGNVSIEGAKVDIK